MNKNVYSIQELFAGRIFSIPDYQRGYAWDDGNCLELLEDIDLLPDGYDHYTGTIVLHANKKQLFDNEGSKHQGYDIVDGQQRLTSLVILLFAIHDNFAEWPAYTTLAAGIEKKFIKIILLEDPRPFYKLSLNADCRTYFERNVLGNGSITGALIRSHERLNNAKGIFVRFLRDKKEQFGTSYQDWLIKFYTKIVERLKVGIYEVDSAAEVGVIFEVMNNRGKDLTELEKVKNYLLYLTTKIDLDTASEAADMINLTWSRIYERFMSAKLGTESENQLLRAHWLIFSNYNKKEWEGSKSIKNKFNLKDYQGKHQDLLGQLFEYLNSIDQASIAFADMERPDRDGSFNGFADTSYQRLIRFHSTKLLRTRTIASFRPIIMACRLRFAEDAKLYLDLIQLLEKFAFRVYNLQGKRADTGQSSLFKVSYELFNNQRSFKDLVGHLKWLLHIYCSDALFRAFWSFDELDNNWYHWSPLKYLLYEYEEHLAGGDPLNISWNYFSEKQLENSVEHILPQMSEDADGYWLKHFSKKEIKIYTHDLGNLCLTYNNSTYRNYGFPRKKGTPGQERPCYANSSLNQERSLTEFENWNFESILKRREEIISWALKRWFVDLGEFDLNVEVPLDVIGEEFEVLTSE